MRVLFASGIDGFCHRYEVLHRAEQVRAAGGEATVVSFLDPRLDALLDRHDVLVLYRVPETSAVASAIERARGSGLAVVGAIDDLVFVDDPALFPELAVRPDEERALWFEGLRRYRATLERCDVVVVSTEALLDEAIAAGLPAVLHRNSVSAAELELGAAAARDADGAARLREACFPGAGPDAVVVGYASGTPSHDRDFAVAAPALASLLDDDPRVRLLLLGPVDPGAALAGRERGIARHPLVPWTDLVRWTAACDAVVAPLALDGRFAAAKGEIKWMEAALGSVPAVASPSSAFRHAIRDGDNGLLAVDDVGWRRALAWIAAEPGARRRMGAAARADVESRFGPGPRARELAAVLESARRVARERRAPRRSADSPWDAPPARVALEPDAHPGALLPMRPVRESPPLCGGHAVEQEFVARRDGLCRVDLHVVTYGLRSAGELELSLASGDGAPVARARIAAEHLPDRAWVALEVPVQPASDGRTFRLRVAMAGEPRDAASLGLADASADAPCARLDGEALDGSLVLRGFAAWGPALAGEAARVPRSELAASSPGAAG